jgi:pimeloyl-ACP methyl ester carboxylesterase
VIVFDNRGVLTSTRGQAPLSIALMADDTAALIHALSYRRVDVRRWSMGGDIAEMLTLQHPGRVRRLILAATDLGSPHAIQPTNPLAVHVLNDPNANTAQVLKAIFPQTATGTAAQKAYVQRLFGWPAVTPNDFSGSRSITREQSVVEGQRQWYCRTCRAIGGCSRFAPARWWPTGARTSWSRGRTRGSSQGGFPARGSRCLRAADMPSCSKNTAHSPCGSRGFLG